MAQSPGEIREAVEQTRQQIGETVQAIAEKTDVKGRPLKRCLEAWTLGVFRASEKQAQ